MKTTKTAPHSRYRLAWSSLILWTAIIFLTIPVAVPLRNWINVKFGRSFFGYTVLTAVVFCLLFAGRCLGAGRTRRILAKNYAWLIAVSGVYAYYTVRLWKAPEEAIHFLEYGMLGYLAYAALRHHVRDRSVFLTASLLTLLVGTLDEIIQWLVPGRYWDLRDVGFNFLGNFLMQVAIYKGFNPEGVSERLTPRSVRIFSLMLGSCLLLFDLAVTHHHHFVGNSQGLGLIVGYINGSNTG